jgi:hypothetical protein
VPEQERAHDLAHEVRAVRQADGAWIQAESTWILQRGAQVGDEACLEAVEDPGDAERDDHAPVPRGPGEPIETRGNRRGDRLHVSEVVESLRHSNRRRNAGRSAGYFASPFTVPAPMSLQ